MKRHINNDIPLACAALPLTGGIRINCNNLHCDICLDPVLKIHDLDGKHKYEGIYHNKIMPQVVSPINCYQVCKKAGAGHDSIWKQGYTWSSCRFNTLTQRCMLAESLNGGGDNKDNRVAATMVNIN